MYYKPLSNTDKYISALSNTGRKNVRIQQQYFYLEKSKAQSTIPKGIFEQCQFQSSIQDSSLQALLDNLMKITASRILDSLILYYHNWSVKLRETYYTLENSFKKTSSAEEFENGMSIVVQKIRQQRTECEKNHISKLARDLQKAPQSYIQNFVSQEQTSEIFPPTTTKTKQRRRKNKKPKITRTRKRIPVHKHRRQKIKSQPLKEDNVSQEALNKTVINLSSKTITNAHKFVFHLGESFAITPSKTNREKLLEDVNSWANSLRMGYVLSRVIKTIPDEEAQEKTLDQHIKQMERDLKIKPSQKKNFLNSGNHALELFLSNVKKQIANHPGKTKSIPKNVSKNTIQAINELSSWNDTVIRLFDKGTGFFVLDKEEYIRRVEVALNDQNTFKRINNPSEQIQETSDAIKLWILKYTDHAECPGLTLNFMEWVTPKVDTNEPGVNYMNFKAHKKEQNYPGRLISTGCNSYIKNLSIFTAEELKKVKLPHCLKDSDELLQKINLLNDSKTLEGKTAYHVTFDIVNMFPSISKEIGIPACRDLLDKRPVKLFSTDCVIDALEITLENNITVFNEKTYVQISGTAMGPNNACQYADTALSPLDQKISSGEEISPPAFYGRFRDDVYVIWTEPLEELDKFLTWLNSYHPNLKFTMSTPSTEGTEFLDLYIYSHDGKIETRTYSKPSDAHSYLLPQSCHPTHIAENIPYGVAHRVFKNCSERSEFVNSKVEFSKYLEDRNYNSDLISNSFDKVEKLDRQSLISKQSSSKNKDRGSDRCFPLVCDFNPGLPPVGRIVNKNKFILEIDPVLKKVIKSENVFVSYRGNKTIKETLVPSKLTNDRKNGLNSANLDDNMITQEDVVTLSDESEEEGCYHCKVRCKTCKLFLCETKTAQSYHTDFKVNIQGRIDCNTVGVCYLVNDKICRRSSVGSTINTFKVRWRNHKSHVRKDVKSCEISRHFNSEFHNIVKDPLNVFDNELSNQLEVIIFEKLDFTHCDSQDDKARIAKERETFWQHQLMTLECYGGLNKRVATNEMKN